MRSDRLITETKTNAARTLVRIFLRVASSLLLLGIAWLLRSRFAGLQQSSLKDWCYRSQWSRILLAYDKTVILVICFFHNRQFWEKAVYIGFTSEGESGRTKSPLEESPSNRLLLGQNPPLLMLKMDTNKMSEYTLVGIYSRVFVL